MKVIFALLLLLAVVGIFWVAAEYHYDNCITAAKADSSLKEQNARDLGISTRLSGCSRLPF